MVFFSCCLYDLLPLFKLLLFLIDLLIILHCTLVSLLFLVLHVMERRAAHLVRDLYPVACPTILECFLLEQAGGLSIRLKWHVQSLLVFLVVGLTLVLLDSLLLLVMLFTFLQVVVVLIVIVAYGA